MNLLSFKLTSEEYTGILTQTESIRKWLANQYISNPKAYYTIVGSLRKNLVSEKTLEKL